MAKHYGGLVKPDTTVSFDMQEYDKTGVTPLFDKEGNPEEITVILNRPSKQNDDDLTTFGEKNTDHLGFLEEAVRLLLPLWPEDREEPWTKAEIQHLILITGGYQREDSLPNRALSLFGRNNPERKKILQEVFAGRLKVDDAMKSLAQSPGQEEEDRLREEAAKAEAAKGEDEGGLSDADPSSGSPDN